jgi:hypothetical protein
LFPCGVWRVRNAFLSCWARIHDRHSDRFCTVVGPSGGDSARVRESAESLFRADPVPGDVDLRWPGMSLSGCELAEGAVRSGSDAVQQVFGQHTSQVMLVSDQQPIEEF